QHALREQVFVGGVGVIRVLADEEDACLLRLLLVLVLVVGGSQADGEQGEGQGEGALEQVGHGAVLRRCAAVYFWRGEEILGPRRGPDHLRPAARLLPCATPQRAPIRYHLWIHLRRAQGASQPCRTPS